MAVIDRSGLLEGDRLRECSDEAQLHWPRLFAASNTLGRIELSCSYLLDTVYRNFKTKPTPDRLAAWIHEYEANYLLFVYEAPDGSIWGQWTTPAKWLPEYQLAADKRSPAPNPDELKAYTQKYAETKRSTYLRVRRSSPKLPEVSGNFPKFRENPENSPNVSEVSQSFGIGKGREGVGKGIGNGGAKESAAPQPDLSDAVNAIVCAHPKSVMRNLRPSEVRQRDQVAVIEAIGDECEAGQCSEVEATQMILQRVQMLADKVPRPEWKFFKDPSEFFRNRDYRLEPEDFSGRGMNGSNIRKSKYDAIDEALGAGGTAAT